ncbi:MAG: cyclic nucleotide-binding domain-containing protein, partial [Candidatus Muiribacteriota bacterium]
MIDINAVKNIEIFENFSDEELDVFFKNAIEMELREGEILFHEGETGTEMFIILSGEISIYKEL